MRPIVECSVPIHSHVSRRADPTDKSLCFPFYGRGGIAAFFSKPPCDQSAAQHLPLHSFSSPFCPISLLSCFRSHSTPLSLPPPMISLPQEARFPQPTTPVRLVSRAQAIGSQNFIQRIEDQHDVWVKEKGGGERTRCGSCARSSRADWVGPGPGPGPTGRQTTSASTVEGGLAQVGRPALCFRRPLTSLKSGQLDLAMPRLSFLT